MYRNITIPKKTIKKWQQTVDVLAGVLEVPAGLLVRIDRNQAEVLISSNTKKNPFQQYERSRLINFPLCKEVVVSESLVEVRNTNIEDCCNGSTSGQRGMISYLGLPVLWPDKSIFGVLCVLDSRERKFTGLHKKLINQFKISIESEINNQILKTQNPTKSLRYKDTKLNDEASDTEKINDILIGSLDNSSSGIIIADASDLTIRYANSTALKMYDGKIDEIVNKPIFTLLKKWKIYYPDGTIIKSNDNPLNRALKRGEETTYKEVILKDKRGKEKWISVSAFPVRDSKNRILAAYETIQDITVNKRLINALKESEDRFRAQYDNFPFPTFTIKHKDNKFIFTDANKAAIKNPFVKTVEIIGNTIDLYFKDEDQDITECVRKTFKNREVSQFEKLYEVKTTGLKRYIRVTTGFLPPDCIVLIFEDLTENKKTEQALQNSELKFRNIFETNPLSIVITQLSNGTIVDVNKAFSKDTGIKKDQALGKNTNELDLYGDPSHRDRIINELTRKGEIIDFETKVRSRDGSFHTALISSKIFTFNDEHYNVTVGRDIQSEREAEIKLKESEEKYRLLIENVPSVFWITDNKGHTNYISHNVKKIYGFSPEEIYKDSKLWLGRVHKRDIEKVKKGFESIFTRNQKFDEQYRIKNKKGEWIWIHDTGIKYIDSEDQELAYGVFSDITKQKKIEIKTKESEIKYRTVFDNANDSIFLMSKNIIVACNLKTLEMFRCKRKDIIGYSPDHFSPEKQPDGRSSREKTIEYTNLVLSGKPQRFEWEHFRKDNILIFTEVTLNTFSIDKQIYILAVVRDITEIKQKQKETIKAVVAAEEEERIRIARDLHDGVSPILSAVKLLSQSMVNCQDDELQKQYVVKIEESVKEAIISVSEISNKISPHILLNFGVTEAIQNFIDKVSTARKVNFQLKSNLDVRLNESLEITLYRAVIELINNTLKHANATRVDIGLSSKQNILLTYIDNGKGFDYDETKKKKKGMGLLNVKTRIESVNGNYYINSKPGKGVIVEISIPKHE
jgi:PAS domain S-box-containing protein